MEDDLRIIKLREYLMRIISTLNSEYQQININFLSNEPDNYSIDRIPVVSEVEPWIVGDTLYRDVYNFRSRMNYSADVIENIGNIGFYESFEKIIKQKNILKNFPEIEGIQSIQCLNCGSLDNTNSNTAEFNIQIQIEYIETEQDLINYNTISL